MISYARIKQYAGDKTDAAVGLEARRLLNESDESA